MKMMVATLIQQILIMALLMAFGAVLIKKGLLSQQGCKDLGRILLNVVIPCVVVRSYITEFSAEKLGELGVSALLAVLALGLSMGISYALFGKERKTENFGSAFGNAGFIGIPLTQALYGTEAVFYVAAFVALLNLGQWTYGLYVMTGDKRNIQLRTVMKNPVLIGILVGFCLFVLPIPVPALLVKTLGYIADLNTPFAMIILGSYLVETNLRGIFLSRSLYLPTLMRLVVIPLATLGLFYLLPVGNPVIVMVALIAAATSVGGGIAIFARLHDVDYVASVNFVCLSTILSILTLPVFFSVAERLIMR